MVHNGWRNPTPGLMQAEKFAKVGERLAIPKSQATKAVKKVASYIGLKPTDVLLLDTLCAFTQEQDWEEGRRPIVWASNAYLEERTGMALRCIQRHVRRLCELGVISMKDSANGKRYGKRGDDGYIQVAYGFDLAPLAARAEEFELLEAHNAEERQLVSSLKQTLTITRRIIRAKIDKARETELRGPWQEFERQFGDLLELLPRGSTRSEKLLNILDMFKDFKTRVEEAFAAAFDWPEVSDAQSTQMETQEKSSVVSFSSNMTPRDDSNDMHILTTNELNPVVSNSFENKDPANIEHNPDRVGGLDSSDDINLDINWNIKDKNRKSEIDIPMLMVACPHFAELARDMGGGYIRNWTDMHRAAAQIRGMAGISQDAWNVANKILGPERAAATIALIFDKQTTGEVKSAGGYLRAMVERAQSGELHLDRSFFGRLSEARVVM